MKKIRVTLKLVLSVPDSTANIGISNSGQVEALQSELTYFAPLLDTRIEVENWEDVVEEIEQYDEECEDSDED